MVPEGGDTLSTLLEWPPVRTARRKNLFLVALQVDLGCGDLLNGSNPLNVNWLERGSLIFLRSLRSLRGLFGGREPARALLAVTVHPGDRDFYTLD